MRGAAVGRRTRRDAWAASFDRARSRSARAAGSPAGRWCSSRLDGERKNACRAARAGAAHLSPDLRSSPADAGRARCARRRARSRKGIRVRPERPPPRRRASPRRARESRRRRLPPNERPTLSLRSTMMRLAVFLPTPGTAVSAATSSSATVRARRDAGIADRIESATFGPMPCTPFSNRNSVRSCSSRNP